MNRMTPIEIHKVWAKLVFDLLELNAVKNSPIIKAVISLSVNEMSNTILRNYE